MRCSVCGSENRKGAKFCGGCGTLLTLSCPECGTEISPTSKFCDSCGAVPPTEFADPKPDADDLTGTRLRAPDTVPNRRQMSLMCCDLVDSRSEERRVGKEC